MSTKNVRCQPAYQSDFVRRVQELRRSSAASPVSRDLTRRMANEDAIAEQLDDFIYGIDYHPGVDHSPEVCTFGCWLQQNPVEMENFVRDIRISDPDQDVWDYLDGDWGDDSDDSWKDYEAYMTAMEILEGD